MDASSNCNIDPLGTAGTVSTSTAYTTLTDNGSSTDPCGYYVYLKYTTTSSTNLVGVFTILTNMGFAITWVNAALGIVVGAAMFSF